MRRQRVGQTLQTTALANEAYLRLVGAEGLAYGALASVIAAQIMRRILVDATRARCAAKRDAGTLRVTMNDQLAIFGGRDANLLSALDDALSALASQDARKVRVVELRFFGGLSVEETAEVLKISPQKRAADRKCWPRRGWRANSAGARAMHPDHWTEIEKLYNAALECEPGERIASGSATARDEGMTRRAAIAARTRTGGIGGLKIPARATSNG